MVSSSWIKLFNQVDTVKILWLFGKGIKIKIVTLIAVQISKKGKMYRRLLNHNEKWV